MITDSTLESRIRETLREVAATAEVPGSVPAQLTKDAQRRYRPALVVAAAFAAVVLGVGAVVLVRPGGSGVVAPGPFAQAKSCNGFVPGAPDYVLGAAADIHPSLLFLPTYVPEVFTLDQAWSTNAGDGCLHSPVFTLVEWAADAPGTVAAVIQVRHGIDFDHTHEEFADGLTGPPPGDHTFEVISYGPDGIIGRAAGAVEVSVIYDGVTLEETMALLDRITLDEVTGALGIAGSTGRFELVRGADVEPVSRVLPLHNWFVADGAVTAEGNHPISFWVRFDPGFTAASRLRSGAELVEVNGNDAVYFSIGATAGVEWEVAPGVLATLHIQGVHLPQRELIEIAASVRQVAADDPAIPPADPSG